MAQHLHAIMSCLINDWSGIVGYQARTSNTDYMPWGRANLLLQTDSPVASPFRHLSFLGRWNAPSGYYSRFEHLSRHKIPRSHRVEPLIPTDLITPKP